MFVVNLYMYILLIHTAPVAVDSTYAVEILLWLFVFATYSPPLTQT